jgi:hypothetical protein
MLGLWRRRLMAMVCGWGQSLRLRLDMPLLNGYLATFWDAIDTAIVLLLQRSGRHGDQTRRLTNLS